MLVLTSLRRRGWALAAGLVLASLAAAQTPPPARNFPPGVERVAIPAVRGVRADLLHSIAPIVEEAIAQGSFPGAVVLASHHGHVIYRGVFGNRSIVPAVRPMRYDTIFDLASLTKVIATTPSVMQLFEKGKIRLDMPVAAYWPEFAANGKGAVTVRELLTHNSGLPPDIPSPELLLLLHLPPTGFPGWPPAQRVDVPWHGEAAAIKMVEQVALINPPGTKFVYSDINFIVLGYLVERLTGEPLNVYAARHVFRPLGMTSTMFLPPAELKNRIAPTQVINGVLRWGVVHDPTAKAMGGVSGLAGLFSDARDLGRYAQCLLNGGVLRVADGKGKTRAARILGPLTVLKMTTPQTPLGSSDIRGLGWDLDSAFSRNRGVLFPMGSFGHTGWTGTSIWIDPYTQTYLIVLTSRVHPTAAPGSGVAAVRAELANIVAASLTDVDTRGLSNTGRGERARAYQPRR